MTAQNAARPPLKRMIAELHLLGWTIDPSKGVAHSFGEPNPAWQAPDRDWWHYTFIAHSVALDHANAYQQEDYDNAPRRTNLK